MLTPEEVAEATFPLERQGFNKDAVRAFLATVADEYDRAVADAAEAASRIVGLDEVTKAKVREAFQAAKEARQLARSAVAGAEERVKGLEQERDRLLVRARDLQLVLDRVRVECESHKAALEAQSVLRQADSYAQLGDQVADVLRAATTTADSVRAEAELQAAQVRGEADNYGTAQRERADQALASARQEAVELRERAESYLNEVQRVAEATARQVKTEADAYARSCVKAAEVEAARLATEAQEKVDKLRATEFQVRRGLEAIGEWVNLSLAAPLDELPLKGDSLLAAPLATT